MPPWSAAAGACGLKKVIVDKVPDHAEHRDDEEDGDDLRGNGTGPASPSSPPPSAPNLAGQNEWYLAKQLRDYRSGKRTHQFMSIVAKDLSDEDIDDLAAWYASIKITVTLPD